MVVPCINLKPCRVRSHFFGLVDGQNGSLYVFFGNGQRVGCCRMAGGCVLGAVAVVVESMEVKRR